MPSRRDFIRMSPEELHRYIRSQKTLIIVSNGANGYPHPLPVFFTVDDENRFYVSTFRKSQKVINFTRDPRASLLIESGSDYHELRSMIAYATATIIDDEATTRQMMTKIGTRAAVSLQPDSDELAKQQAPKRVIIRFTPHHVVSWDHSKLDGRY
jgi:nitroimidazol reductase NimA-like FMN-containing flavoprotein (pyridoxamine 5'-phosphate oxidase superfamily)